MLELIQKLFVGHVHKYTIIKEIRVFDQSYDKMPCATKYVCQCEHCGKIKHYVV